MRLLPRNTKLGLLLCAALVAGCGAEERASAPATVEDRVASPEADDPADPPPTEDPPTEELPPATDPPPARRAVVEIEPGVRLGAVRLGMSEADLQALGLPEAVVDPRTRSFGPYDVTLGADGVRRVEAQIGALGSVSLGGQTFEAGVHIHALRDAAGDCVWQEGGGERYRCADGGLFIETTHTLDPQRYTLRVER